MSSQLYFKTSNCHEVSTHVRMQNKCFTPNPLILIMMIIITKNFIFLIFIYQDVIWLRVIQLLPLVLDQHFQTSKQNFTNTAKMKNIKQKESQTLHEWQNYSSWAMSSVCRILWDVFYFPLLFSRIFSCLKFLKFEAIKWLNRELATEFRRSSDATRRDSTVLRYNCLTYRLCDT